METKYQFASVAEAVAELSSCGYSSLEEKGLAARIMYNKDTKMLAVIQHEGFLDVVVYTSVLE